MCKQLQSVGGWLPVELLKPSWKLCSNMTEKLAYLEIITNLPRKLDVQK